MPRPIGGYHLTNGTRVPSVTTIISRFKESAGLINWAWQMGKEGKDYREERNIAADAGTLAHAAAESWTKNREPEWIGGEEVITKAKIAYGAFEKWRDQTQLVITETEMPLVSEIHKFGGTFDAILVRDGRAIGDWKSSNAIYPEYLVQVAAYGLLWEENFPDQPITAGYHILRFDKTYGDFHAHFWQDLTSARRAFLLLRELYEIQKELVKRSK